MASDYQPLLDAAPDALGTAMSVPIFRSAAATAFRKMIKDAISFRALLVLIASLACGWKLTMRGGCDLNEHGICPIMSQELYQSFAPSNITLQEWFHIFHLHDLMNMTAPQASGGFDEKQATDKQTEAHETLWVAVLFFKVMILTGSVTMWWAVSTKLWPKFRVEREYHPEFNHDCLRCLFVVYSATHHLALFLGMNVAMVNGYISEASLAYEGYNCFFNWVIVVLNVTAIVTYASHAGQRLESPIFGVISTLVPGFGQDAMLLKEFVFSAYCSLHAQDAMQSGAQVQAFVGNTCGAATILFSLCLFKDMYESKEALLGFLQSHWPTVLCKLDSGTPMLSIKWIAKQFIQQSNIAKGIQAEKQNLPQVFIELLILFCFGFHATVVVAFSMSITKILLIRLGRIFVAHWISSAQRRDLLVDFFEANGFQRDFPGQRHALCVAEDNAWEDEGGKILLLCLGTSESTSMADIYGWPGDDLGKCEDLALLKKVKAVTFRRVFNQPVEKVALPSGLQSLTFGCLFNQPMEKVALPSGLQSLTFGDLFNQPMEKVALPSGLQSLAFGCDFNQPMEKVALPSGLQSLTFGWNFTQPMEKVALPSGLQSLAFGGAFNQPMEKVALPSGLRSLTFGFYFNQPMEKVALPSGLQSLTFGHGFNQPMEKVALPSGLQSLTFGRDFNQPMEKVALPSAVKVYHH